MARAWTTDLWAKDATVTMPDGSTHKISPTSAQLKSVKSLPEHFRTSKWMTGKRWRTAWQENDGGRDVQRAKVFATKAEAEAFAAELEDDIRMGRYIDPSARERPLAEVAEEWLSSKKKVKESTLIRYREGLDYYVLPKWGQTQLGAITRPKVDAWVSELLSGTAPTNFSRKKTAPSLSPASIRHIVRVAFGSVIRYALATRAITVDPLAGVELPRDDDTEVEKLRVLSHAGINALSAAVGEASARKCDVTLTYLLSYSGPRINEALALQVRDIDLDTMSASVRRTWTRSKDGWKLGPPKTWQEREIPLADFLKPALEQLVEGHEPTAFLFRDEAGAALDYKQWYSKVWVTALAASGAPKGFTPHDLRHTAASMAIAAGADVKIVQQMLGHKDATETLNTYSHLWPNRLREVMHAMSTHRNAALEDDGDDRIEAAA